MNLENQLLTPNQVSRILGVKRHTLAVWRCSGRYRLPYVKVGRLVHYRNEDVNTFLLEQSRNSTGLLEATA
jgi:predicted site-specific integrase-resolvase